MRSALAGLAGDDATDPDEAAAEHDLAEERLEAKVSLHERRLASVLAELQATGAKRVLDLGCGNGRFLVASALRRPTMDHLGIDLVPPAGTG